MISLTGQIPLKNYIFYVFNEYKDDYIQRLNSRATLYNLEQEKKHSVYSLL